MPIEIRNDLQRLIEFIKEQINGSNKLIIGIDGDTGDRKSALSCEICYFQGSHRTKHIELDDYLENEGQFYQKSYRL